MKTRPAGTPGTLRASARPSSSSRAERIAADVCARLADPGANAAALVAARTRDQARARQRDEADALDADLLRTALRYATWDRRARLVDVLRLCALDTLLPLGTERTLAMLARIDQLADRDSSGAAQ